MERDEAWRRIRTATAQRNWVDLAGVALRLVEQTTLPESEWNRAARALADAYIGMDDPIAAATTRLAAGDAVGALALVKDVPAEAALVCRARGDARGAAERFLAAGLPAQAAVAFEQAEDFDAARAIWEQVLADPRLRRELYVRALVAFNHGRCASKRDDREVARRSFVRATGLLEEAADEFASRGERERAFDCYQVVLTLGREEGQFENIAEGFLSSARILREDLLKHWVLHYIEEFLRECAAREEFHAAATLLRETAEYVRQQGLDTERWYRRRCAVAWQKTAEHALATGAPLELVENAMLASIDAWSSVGAFSQVREAYVRLAALELPEPRRERYRKIARRYEAAVDAPTGDEPKVEHLHRKMTYPDVWHADVVEWEHGGDAAALAGDLVADPQSTPTARRLALLCRLAAYDAASGDAAKSVKLAERLAKLQVWAALSPLERLFATGTPPVRAAAVRAVRTMYFKRSFVVVRRALEDSAEEVRKEALEAVRDLRFPAGFDPLQRIFRRSRDPAVRRTALRSIGGISAIEAAEHLLDVIRTEEPALRDEAARLLSDMQLPELDSLLRRHAPTNPVVARVLRARGHSPRV